MAKWPPETQERVERLLMERADGLFRWVDCQLDALRKCLRVNTINTVLETLPRTLNETYDRILASVDQSHINDTRKILACLVCCARPMRICEINEILAIDREAPDSPRFESGLRFDFFEDIHTVCSSLVVVTPMQVKEQTAPNENSEIRLAHHSVKDYLLSHHIVQGPARYCALETLTAHSFLATSCLTYLLQFQSRLDVQTVQNYPLCGYAARFWPEHVRPCENNDSGLVFRLAVRLLEDKVAYRNCCAIYDPHKPWQSPVTPWQGMILDEDIPIPPLYYTSLTGLRRLTKALLQAGADPDQYIPSPVGTALWAAAYRGDLGIMKDLLDAKAAINGNDCWVPIHAAASQGHEAAVKFFIEAGAKIDKRTEDETGSALYLAVESGHVSIVKLLLSAGADALAWAGMSGVVLAIEFAAARGDLELVNLLLPRGSIEHAMKTAAQSGHRSLFEALLEHEGAEKFALECAVSAGWSDIVRSLLDRQPESEDGKYLTGDLLRAAAYTGSLDTAQTIFESDVGADPSEDDLNRALGVAAQWGRLNMVQYLLYRGANVKSTQCGDALILAVEGGHLAVVEVLLIGGLDPNPRQHGTNWEDSPSPLYRAALYNRTTIARLLLSSGADANAWKTARGTGPSALFASIEKNNEQLFNLLLDSGATTEFDKIEGQVNYDTLFLAVHCAASVGNEAILRKVLDSGLGRVDDVLINQGWTAIFHAAKGGHDDILRILINECDADVNRRAKNGILAIHTAAFHNHPRCIGVFLEAGLDIDATCESGKTSLHWAAGEGSVEAVLYLIEKGADPMIEERGTRMRAVDFAMQTASRLANRKWGDQKMQAERYAAVAKILQG